MNSQTTSASASAPWYIARIKPGWSRIAPDRVITRGGDAGSPLQPDRLGETQIERSLRDAGFDCYFPRMRKEVVDRRRRRTTVRAFPLFTGYVFVNGVATQCDGVAEVLGIRMEGRPSAVPANVVEAFRSAERGMAFDDTREARIKRREQGRTWLETVKMQFPLGAVVGIRDSAHPFHGFHGEVVSVTGKGMVRVMMTLFGGAAPVEVDARELVAAA